MAFFYGEFAKAFVVVGEGGLCFLSHFLLLANGLIVSVF